LRAGWYNAFLADPLGAIAVGTREVPIRAVRRRGVRLWTAIDKAYAAKYNTPGSVKYVRGFRTRSRRETTIEFVSRRRR
jgi:hypothetical protein